MQQLMCRMRTLFSKKEEVMNGVQNDIGTLPPSHTPPSNADRATDEVARHVADKEAIVRVAQLAGTGH